MPAIEYHDSRDQLKGADKVEAPKQRQRIVCCQVTGGEFSSGEAAGDDGGWLFPSGFRGWNEQKWKREGNGGVGEMEAKAHELT